MTKKTKKYAFIGAGNMGQALIQGARESGISGKDISVSDPSVAAREKCASLFDTNTFSNNEEAAINADIVVLSVKPQITGKALQCLAASRRNNPLYISIAAGITLDQLNKCSEKDIAIVRCMPNTPAIIRKGITALIANQNVTKPQRFDAENLLTAVGKIVWLNKESLMDAVTAISGSGPAYFFMLIELLENSAVELGLSAELAKELAVQTAYGACELARNAPESPGELRLNVTSPNGTTDAALKVFAAEEIDRIVRSAVTAARDRSIELSKGN